MICDKCGIDAIEDGKGCSYCPANQQDLAAEAADTLGAAPTEEADAEASLVGDVAPKKGRTSKKGKK